MPEKIVKLRLGKPKKPETNTEFLTRMMEFSKHGTLMQMFIMSAIDEAANRFTAMSLDDVEKVMGDLTNLVNAEAWHGTAKELKDELDKKHEL